MYITPVHPAVDPLSAGVLGSSYQRGLSRWAAERHALLDAVRPRRPRRPFLALTRAGIKTDPRAVLTRTVDAEPAKC